MLTGAGGAAGEALAGPSVDPGELWRVVLLLGQVGALASAAAEGLPAPESGWSGEAAGAFVRARDTAGSRLGVAAAAAGTVAQVLSRYAQAVQVAQSEVTACQQLLDEIEMDRVRSAVLMAAGSPDPGWADLGPRMRAVRSRYAAAMRTYAGAVTTAAQALAAVYEQVPAAARGMTAGDRVEQAWRGFGQAALVAPVQGVWAFTGEALVDRRQWAAAVEGLPAATLDQAVHPIRTAGQVLGLDAFAHDNGDWTQAAGIAAGSMAGLAGGGAGRDGRLLGEVAKVSEREPLQSLAETLAGVDLRNHENRGSGRHRSHGLTKHVGVGRAAQERRLRHERVPVGGLAEGETVDVSEFFELSTAERWITEALNNNLGTIDRWLQSGTKPKTISLRVPPHVGEVLRLHADGHISVEPPTRLIVVLARDVEGPHVLTFYLQSSHRRGGTP